MASLTGWWNLADPSYLAKFACKFKVRLRRSRVLYQKEQCISFDNWVSWASIEVPVPAYSATSLFPPFTSQHTCIWRKIFSMKVTTANNCRFLRHLDQLPLRTCFRTFDWHNLTFFDAISGMPAAYLTTPAGKSFINLLLDSLLIPDTQTWWRRGCRSRRGRVKHITKAYKMRFSKFVRIDAYRYLPTNHNDIR